MPLKLSLKPGERFVINGAVVANGERRTTLIIQNKVNILRERDILQRDEADTPAKRLYFAVMMMYLDPENDQSYYQDFAERMTEFVGAVSDADALRASVSANRYVMARDYYRALVACRALLDHERRAMDGAAADSGGAAAR
jgi:flagellar protein FlbT